MALQPHGGDGGLKGAGEGMGAVAWELSLAVL